MPRGSQGCQELRGCRDADEGAVDGVEGFRIADVRAQEEEWHCEQKDNDDGVAGSVSTSSRQPQLGHGKAGRS